jgi:hypothetical protein
VARLSGISEKGLVERSRIWRVLDTGERLVADMEVKELSARLKCRRNLHLEAGRKP